MSRAYCYQCFKPQVLCVCDVVPVTNATHVRIIQHPAERQHPINSARLLALGLARANIEIAWRGSIARPADLSTRTVVLFPAAGSRNVADLAEHERPDEIVVIDGTWSQARKLYRRNEWIRSLSHVHIEPQAPSRYRIRRQPQPDYLSSLEATVAALRALEPKTRGFERLEQRFDQMIEVQARFIANPPPGGYRHQQIDISDKPVLPPTAIACQRQLVVCYADFTKRTATGGESVLTPVVVSLARPQTGERMTAIFSHPGEPPAAKHLEHMGIHRDQYASSPSCSGLQERLASFLKKGDILVSWNARIAKRIAELSIHPHQTVCLKADYCNWTRQPVGHLHDELLRLQKLNHRVQISEKVVRAERRLEAALEVLRWLKRDYEAVRRKRSERRPA